MPSPYPGMDPYIEGDLFESFHGPFAVEIGRQLNRQLGPKYYALVERRIMSDTPDDEITIRESSRKPDVSVLRERDSPRQSGTAILDAPVKMRAPLVETMMHYTVEVHDASERELITAIEILSPANKRGKGRDQYVDKRVRTFNAGVHLVEIDLLRTGHRLPMEQSYPNAPYFVLIHRAEARQHIADVWPIHGNEPLPRIPIPLSNGDTPAVVDLQDALTSVYSDFKFDMVIDYSKPPPVGTLAWKGQSSQ